MASFAWYPRHVPCSGRQPPSRFAGLAKPQKRSWRRLPLAVLALDSALVSGTLAQALRDRWRFYLMLFVAWIWTAALVLHSGSRSGTVGVTEKHSPFTYFADQCGYLLNYLRLSIWPAGQVFDYGLELKPWDGSQLPQVLAILALIAAIFVLCWRSPKLGVIGLIPMLILAPTSSFIPVITQVAVEHRMYLPLASVATICVLLLHSLVSRLFPSDLRRQRIAISLVVSVLAIGLGTATYLRNRVYATDLALWEDTMRKCPTNIRAYVAVADSLIKKDRSVDARKFFEPALAEPWNRAAALRGVSRIWMTEEKFPAAIATLQEALQVDPADAVTYNDLAVAYGEEKDWKPMLQAANEAIKLDPQMATAHMNRGVALANLGHEEEGVAAHKKSVELQPFVSQAHGLLGSYWYSRGKLDEAIASFKQAIYYKATDSDAQYWLAAAYLKQGNLVDALLTADALVSHDKNPRGWEMLASIYETGGDVPAARRTLIDAIQANPKSPGLQLRLGRLLGKSGKWQEAMPAFHAAAQLAPKSAEAVANYAAALLAVGNAVEARQQAERALELDPKNALARRVQSQLEPTGS